ncbi:spore gernimation protein [Salipaludibacillus neizhouensis]|uniref:Spore gernimation protein n=1 Tax=Salipaludibacillus neizhouensis TaxID=885475 RepID=A0A3A9KMX3_9BACI|nr:spore germination protein GerPC [Salipaludibacillus neizhouensis]RKL69265.1 spore gernimation protein [Salipaludibacillus neizhouensis]
MYNNNPDVIQQIQQLYWHLNSQYERISKLETDNEQLKNEMATLKENHVSRVDRIDYKFDQLKIERLEGTLNIGLSPNHGQGTIDDFSVNQQDLNVPPVKQQNSEFFRTIQEQVHEYLNEESFRDIESIENQYNKPLNNDYREYIVEDIRKQIDSRIEHYLSKTDLNNLTQEESERLKNMTISKVKEDIHNTCVEFVRHLPRKENE